MKRKLLVLTAVVVLILTGSWIADHKLKGLGHPGLRTFVDQWWTNYPASFAVEPLELSINVDQQDLDALERVVQAARDRGVIMPEGNDYVGAELQLDGKSFKAKVRIKGKMSDHVQGSKWSFRVIAKKDKGFLGMQRFSLQHPGTRNYLCDWLYHKLSNGEGIIALRYGFIRLKFNGEDLGVYAYEEHFGPELLANNGRMKGPLFRFDPSLFWEHRLNMINKVRYDEAFGTYQAAAVDAFGSSELEKDTVQRGYFAKAVGMMDAFRRGELSASEVFNADLVARRHALLDLVGGHHSMDWSDVKFYYDPVLQRIEPVAYESFSAFPIRTLVGSNKYVGKQKASMDLHDAYFNDPVIYRAYVHHLERVSAPAYMDSVFKALAPALDSASAILYREFPYKELDRSVYAKNQRVIRKILDVPKGFHAYNNGGKDTLRITVVPVESLPMEVHGLIAEDGSVVPVAAGSAIIPIRPASGLGVPVELRFATNKLDTAGGKPLRLSYGVLGASMKKELEVFPYAYLDGVSIPLISSRNTDLRSLEFLRVDEASRTITFVPGKWSIASDLYIPAGYTITATSPLQLDLQKGARIVSRSPIQFGGVEDLPILLRSSDHSGGGLILNAPNERSIFRRVRFEGFGVNAEGTPGVVLQEGSAEMVECNFGEDRGRDILLAVRMHLRVEGCTFTGGKDQVTVAYSFTTIAATNFLGAGDDGFSIKGGTTRANDVTMDGALGAGLKLDEFAQANFNNTSVRVKGDCVKVSEGAVLNMTDGSMTSSKGEALDVDAVHGRHGASTVVFNKVTLTATGHRLKIGKGNNVRIDGEKMDPTPKVLP